MKVTKNEKLIVISGITGASASGTAKILLPLLDMDVPFFVSIFLYVFFLLIIVAFVMKSLLFISKLVFEVNKDENTTNK